MTARRMGEAMRALLASLRVHQWAKNVVVLAPVVFAGRLFSTGALQAALASAACFCVASSGVYLANDAADRRVDRLHPVKRGRPLARGLISAPVAAAWSGVLMSLAVGLGTLLHPSLGAVLVLYVVLNLAYTLLLKRHVIIDVIALAIGFVLRVWAGSVVIGVVPSHWLQLSVFFLALFLALAKRRQEMVMLHARALRHRRVLADYSLGFIDQMMPVLAGMAMLCYALYAVSPETSRAGNVGFIYTVPFVLYGMFRYLYLLYVRQRLGDPSEIVLSDWPSLACAALWTAAVVWILYR